MAEEGGGSCRKSRTRISKGKKVRASRKAEENLYLKEGQGLPRRAEGYKSAEEENRCVKGGEPAEEEKRRKERERRLMENETMFLKEKKTTKKKKST